MPEVIYKGDHAGVVVPITPTMSLTCKWGEAVDVPEKIATSLLESDSWMKSSKKAGKKAAPEAVDNDNNEGKG